MGVTTEFGELVWGPARALVDGELQNFSLDDSDDSVGASFVLPASGAITHVGWYLNSKTGTPPNYYVGLLTVDASDGNPTSTAYGSSVAATIDPTALSVGWVWTELSTAATATAGDQVIARIWATGSPGNPDASNCINVNFAHYALIQALPLAWSSGNLLIGLTRNLSNIALRYSDGTVIGLPLGPAAYTAYDSADTPDEIGVKFTLPYAMRCIGVRFGLAAQSPNVSYTFKLYDGSDTLLASWIVLDEDQLIGTRFVEVYWSSAVTLTAETIYRLTILATNAFSTITPANMTWPDAYCKTAYHQGAAFVATSRSDGGAWTDNTDATVFISPIVDQITLPGGSSGPRWL